MDEKLFYTVIKRRHTKQITSLVTELVAHKTHHTSHMYNVLRIATSAFLPTDNDIEKGGRALSVTLDRVERVERTNEHCYKRFYAPDGRSYI